MANDINKVVVVGRLTRDVEMVDGQQIAKFSIATNEKFKKKDGETIENTSFFDVTAFGKFAEMLGQWLKKGQQVIVEGKLKQERWEQDGQKRSKIGIICSNIQFIGGKNEDQQQQPSSPTPPPISNNPFSDDDMPF